MIYRMLDCKMIFFLILSTSDGRYTIFLGCMNTHNYRLHVIFLNGKVVDDIGLDEI